MYRIPINYSAGIVANFIDYVTYWYYNIEVTELQVIEENDLPMKRVFALILGMFLALSMVSCGSNTPKSNIEVDLETGTFSVTPQEFIDQWNAAVKDFQKSSDDKKTEYIKLLPDFSASGEVIKMSDGLTVTYSVNDENQKLSEVEITWFPYALSNADKLTSAFMRNSLPFFFNQETEVDLSAIPMNVDEMATDDFTDYDANITYEYIGLDGIGSISIKPLNFGDDQ